MLRVPGALARGKRGKHAERFELHDVMVQIQLHIAAPVGALADRVYLAADRQPLAEIFRRDFAPRRIDAELQACPERQVPRADLLGAEPQPLVREQLAGDRRVVRIIRPAALRRGPEAVPAVNPPALLRLQPVGQILRLAVKQIGLPRAAQMYDSDAEIQRGGSLRPAVRQPDQIAELSSGARQAARLPRWLKIRSRM